MFKEFVECGSHGSSRPAFICRHLAYESNVGWNEPQVYNKSPNEPFYGCVNAWCDDCEKIAVLTNGIVENSYADVLLVCEECALKIKHSYLK